MKGKGASSAGAGTSASRGLPFARALRGSGLAVLLGVVLLLVLAALAVLVLPFARRSLLESVGDDLDARASLVASHIGRQIEGNAATLQVIARQRPFLSAFEEGDFERVESQLETLITGPLQAREVLITEPRGRELWRFPSNANTGGRENFRASWRMAVEANDGGWVATIDTVDDTGVLHVAVPVRTVTGARQAYLAARTPVSVRVVDTVEEIAWPRGLVIATDARGLGTDARLQEGWRVDTLSSGEGVLRAAAPVVGTTWTLIASRPLDSVLVPFWTLVLAIGIAAVALYVPVMFIGVAWGRAVRRDLEARDTMEKELRHAKESLEERVRERTGELSRLNRRMAEELEQRKRAEEALRESEERYRVVAETAADAVITFDTTGFLRFASQATETIFGRSPYDVVGKPFSLLLPEGLETLLEAGRTGAGARSPTQLVGRHRNGEAVDLEVSVSSYEIDGEPLFTAIVRDVSERIRLQKRLRESEERYALAARGANDGLWDWDLSTDHVYYSRRWKAMLGYRDEEIESSPSEWLDRVHPEDRADLEEQLRGHLDGELSHFQSEHRLTCRDGSTMWVLARGLAVRDSEGEATRIAGSLTDVTERKMAEERLAHEALHDVLTDLPNRAMFMDRLGQVVERARREPAYSFAVLFLDLDGFKVINDSLGHTFGDKVLVGAARRLENCIRPGDTLARLGGDEFVVLLDGADDEISERVASRVQEHLAQPLIVEGREIFTTASIGIAIGSPQYEHAEELLRDADVAMYRAKESGKARFTVFERSMRESAVGRLQGETELRRALENDVLVIHYQPILQLRDGRLVGFEALVRWPHPEREVLPAKEFIHLAEETGLILPLGSWVVGEAVRQLSTWRAQIPSVGSLRINVNLSGRHFGRSELVSEIRELLETCEVPPTSLMLEITEGILMDRDEETAAVFADLEALGVGLCLDDFGTGYSSLSYLHEVPISMLKIDQSFVQRLGREESGTEIVRTILALGGALDLDTVAEGVESGEQLESLRFLGCELVQGFHLGLPQSADDATALLRRLTGGGEDEGKRTRGTEGGQPED